MKIPAFLLACLGLLVGLGCAMANEPKPDLSGQVTEINGTPIAGASVFIYTARPKKGTSSLCPYCYPDCQKKAKTDANGRFKIESLDPTLLFRLLILADGHEREFVSRVDPAKGEQIVKLKPLNQAELKSNLRIKGLVIDEQGKPVAGATISPEGVKMGGMTRWGGNDRLVDPLAVAGEHGRFLLFCRSNSVDKIYATVEGRGVAKQWVTFKPGDDYLVRLPEGVTFTGQVLRGGRPVKGVSIAATTTDRACGSYLDCAPVSTGNNGRFTLMNVPPNRKFTVFATMKSLHGNGALPDKIVTSGNSGTVQDLGKLEIQPAFTIAGRVVLSDGKPIPAHSRLFLGRQKTTDSRKTVLDAEGHFEFKGVPAGSVALTIRSKGYRLSKRNPSLDWLNGRILGRVTGNIKDLVILMEPGKWNFNNEADRPGGDDDYPVNKPLRSVKL